MEELNELELYQEQLSRVESMLDVDPSEELEGLKEDLIEAINLIEASEQSSNLNSVANDLKPEPVFKEVSSDDDPIPSSDLQAAANSASSNSVREADQSTKRIKQEVILLDSDEEAEDDDVTEILQTKSSKPQAEEIILDDDDDEVTLLNDYDQLIGESYLVPYIIYSKLEMHEAEIVRVIDIEENGDAKLEVRFLNPLNAAMKHCTKCNMSPSSNAKQSLLKLSCPYSHKGHIVNLSMIKDIHDSSAIKVHSDCLYSEVDSEFWKRGKVVYRKSDLCTVRSNETQEHIVVKLDRIRLFDSNSDVDDHQEVDKRYEFQDRNPWLNQEDKQPVNLETTYSNSIGLKLLKMQGYQCGDGLGKNRNGIVDPIKLTVFPANTSLDTCIELKEKGYLSTSADKFTYEKQKHYFKNLILKKNQKKIKRKEEPNKGDRMFKTLNQSIATKSPRQAAPTCVYSRLKVIQQEIKNVDNINVDMFKIEKDIKRLQDDIEHCKKSINLCKEMNPANLKNLNTKLSSKEGQLCTNQMKLKVLKEKKKRLDYDRNVKYF